MNGPHTPIERVAIERYISVNQVKSRRMNENKHRTERVRRQIRVAKEKKMRRQQLECLKLMKCHNFCVRLIFDDNSSEIRAFRQCHCVINGKPTIVLSVTVARSGAIV